MRKRTSKKVPPKPKTFTEVFTITPSATVSPAEDLAAQIKKVCDDYRAKTGDNLSCTRGVPEKGPPVNVSVTFTVIRTPRFG